MEEFLFIARTTAEHQFALVESLRAEVLEANTATARAINELHKKLENVLVLVNVGDVRGKGESIAKHDPSKCCTHCGTEHAPETAKCIGCNKCRRL